MFTHRSCNCIKPYKKHLLTYLPQATSIHAASYIRQAFLTLFLKTNEKELHKSYSEPIAFALHARPFFFLHHSRAGPQVFDAPRSCYDGILSYCSCTKGIQEFKSASTAPRHFDKNKCLIREQVDSTRARNEKTVTRRLH
jgi:hypothetical protein